jgi:hypothetical protein
VCRKGDMRAYSRQEKQTEAKARVWGVNTQQPKFPKDRMHAKPPPAPLAGETHNGGAPEVGDVLTGCRAYLGRYHFSRVWRF